MIKRSPIDKFECLANMLAAIVCGNYGFREKPQNQSGHKYEIVKSMTIQGVAVDFSLKAEMWTGIDTGRSTLALLRVIDATKKGAIAGGDPDALCVYYALCTAMPSQLTGDIDNLTGDIDNDGLLEKTKDKIIKVINVLPRIEAMSREDLVREAVMYLTNHIGDRVVDNPSVNYYIEALREDPFLPYTDPFRFASFKSDVCSGNIKLVLFQYVFDLAIIVSAMVDKTIR